MDIKMNHDRTDSANGVDSQRERGAAIIIALMVSLVLAFLGLGLLLQTSLGLQAAGTDRWVARALYAADAGAQAEIATLASGAAGTGTFVFADDPGIPGMLAGQYNVTLSDLCLLEPDTEALLSETGKWVARHFHFRSTASRTATVLVGLTQATITQDVTIEPISVDNLQEAPNCY